MSRLGNAIISIFRKGEKRISSEQFEQAVGLHNAHTPLLLEGGMTYERISIPPEDAQFIATRKFHLHRVRQSGNQ